MTATVTSDQPVDSSMSLACDLKGKQKQFILHQNSARSCCKSFGVALSEFESFDQLNAHWLDEKQQLNLGYPVASCQYCWNNEAQGITSFRQLNLSASDEIELTFDNLCNQMCSYCSPKFSSQWEKSVKQQGLFVNVGANVNRNFELTLYDPSMIWLQRIQAYIDTQPDKTVSIRLLGGEPLMQRKSLLQLIKFNEHKVKQLIVTTNLNPPSNRFLRWLLDTVPNDTLKFEISIDATPEFNHVPRGLFDSQRFQTNLALIKSCDVEYVFLSVVSALSIFDLPNFMAWCHKHNHPYSLMPINNPACLDPKIVPHNFRQAIVCDGLPQHVREILAHSEPLVDIKLFEQYNYLKQYFHRTGITATMIPNNLFQQYWSWLENKFYEISNRIRPAS